MLASDCELFRHLATYDPFVYTVAMDTVHCKDELI